MKVLLLTPSPARPGGIQRYTATLVRVLNDLLGDQSVRCVGLNEDPANQGSGRLSARSKWRFGWDAVLEAVRWRPDLIICTHLALGPVGWLLAKLGRRPYWIVMHGIEAWRSLPSWKRAALRQADRVIVTSAFSRDRVLKRHEIKPECISTLPCAVDERLTCVQSARDGLERSLFAGRRVIVTVGRMASSEQYKGHDMVLRALPAVTGRVPNLTYLIVGGGDDRPRLESLTKGLGLGQHVVFAGEVSDSDLVALYHQSEVFVLPARTVLDDREPKGEGFGIVFLEAMSFGIPAVGPSYGAPAEIIKHKEHGLLVDPEDPAAVANALVDLLSNPDKAREMGQAASDWVRKQYSYAAFREKLREILTGAHAVDRDENSMSNVGRKTATAKSLLVALFVLWVIAINVLYYLQYRNLLLARFARLLHRWH